MSDPSFSRRAVVAAQLEASVPALFEAQLERAPDAPALEYSGRVLTYSQLADAASAVRATLQDRGVEPGTFVGLCAERGPELIAGMLGILQAGCAYVALDPSFPRIRMESILRDAGVGLLLSAELAETDVPEFGGEVLSLTAAVESRGERAPRDASVIPAAAPAYVMYTSGSTGAPKGVCVPHVGIVRLVLDTDYVTLGPAERIAQAANPAFDACTFEIWGALLNGGCVVGIDREEMLSPPHLRQIFIDRRITTFFVTTALFNRLVDEDPGIFEPLRYVLMGGEAVDPVRVRAALLGGPPRHLLHVYGPTENTTFSTWHEVAEVAEGAVTVPIGRAIAHSTAVVLGSSLEPVADGETGELHVGGLGVALGYLRRPALTAERFVPDPFGEPGSRLYATGDLARRDENGAIEFVGRADGQIKLRGFRIEIGEIESVLAKCPGVGEAVVMVREDSPGRRELVAYVAGAGGPAPESADLLGQIAERLPAFMVPAHVVAMDRLPLNTNGKIDRSALPAPHRPSGGVTAGRDETERRLAAICATVLGVQEVGIDEGLFDLGATSLDVAGIAARTASELGVDVPMRTLFANPTVAELAYEIKTRSGEGGRSEGIERVDRALRLPLSFSQERVWILTQIDPASRAYLFPSTIEFEGPLDPDALRATLTEIIRRHEIFRTTFPAGTDGRPYQWIHPPYAVDLPVVRVEGETEAERRGHLQSFLDVEFASPMDLKRLPLVRWKLFRIGETTHVLSHVEQHIVHDGWSFNIFLSELRKVYAAFVEGRPSPLEELPIQFADFAAWQRRWMHSEEASRQAAYWKAKLAGAPALLELPLDRPRPDVQSFEGSTVRVDFPPELVRGLRRLAHAEHASLYTTLLTGFIELFHWYSGQEDLCVSAPVATRGFPETESLLGMLINNVVIRADLAGDPTVSELLRRIRDISFEAFSHQELPLDRVVQEVNPPRNPGYNPLFQVGIGFHDSRVDLGRVAGIEMTAQMALSNGSSKFDMAVAMLPYTSQWIDRGIDPDENGVTAVIEYSTALFNRSTVERMAANLVRLLEGMASDPSMRLSELALLCDQEQGAWNATSRGYAYEGGVHQEFSAWAARQPNAVALRSGDRTWTYGELEQRSHRLAGHLRSLGVGSEVVVGVHADRSLEMVLGKLAVLRAGGTYLPLDPTYPEYRLAYMIEDSGAAAVLTQRSLRSDLPVCPVPVVELEDESSWAGESTADQDGAGGVDAQSQAYVIYTSGSTGRPKGVSVEHGALSNLVGWHRERYSVSPEDRATQVAAMGFDACVWELWPYLASGASVDVVPDAERTDPARLWEWYRRQGTTLSFLPTPLAEAALKEPVPDGLKLRALLTGGDRLQRGVALGSLPFALVNHYGPTENAVVATAGDVGEEAPPPIGGPIGNVQMHVLDRSLHPVPLGMVGELYVGGTSLARGYVGHPDLTAERFVPSPFGDGERLYRTGDLGRWRADGTIDFLGRNDDQVKVRGFRIELGEIEHQLALHPEVRDAVVLARKEQSGERRLVAYVVLRAEEPSHVDEIRDSLRGRLPDYMVPSAFVVLDELPLTPNGKVDRKALPEPDLSAEARAGNYVAPRNESEQALVAIWQKFLRVGRIGIHDNFFELGGDSILSFQVAAAARERGIHLTPKQMFQEHTVAKQVAAAGGRAVVRAEQGEITGEAGLMPAQLWWLSMELSEPHHFNQSHILELRQPVPQAALKSAVEAVMQHHDALRSRLTREAGEWRLVIGPSGGDVPFEQFDLRDVDAAERVGAIERAATEVQRGLNFEQGPLFRVGLIEVGGDEPDLLILVAHHLVVDGLSWRVVIEDLATACEQRQAGEEIRLPAKTTSVVEWAARLRGEAAGGDELRSELDYWAAQSRPDFALPRDADVGAEANTHATSRIASQHLGEEATRSLLQDVTQAFGTEINDVLVTGLVRAMEPWTGRRDQVIFMDGHGREPLFDGVDVSRTMGWFTSMYPVHVELPRGWQPERSVLAVAEQLSQTPRRGVGYLMLKFLEEPHVSQVLRATAEPEMTFNYLGQLDQALASSSLFGWSSAPVGPRRSPLGRRPALLDFFAEVRGGRLQVACSYSTAVHEERTIASVLDRWVAALGELIASAADSVGGLATAKAVSRGDLDRQDLDRLLEELD